MMAVPATIQGHCPTHVTQDYLAFMYKIPSKLGEETREDSVHKQLTILLSKQTYCPPKKQLKKTTVFS